RELREGFNEPAVLVEQVVLRGQDKRDLQLLKDLRPPPVTEFFLVEVGEEQPSECAHSGAQNSKLRRRRPEGTNERHAQRADKRGAEELETDKDGSLRIGNLVGHGADATTELWSGQALMGKL